MSLLNDALRDAEQRQTRPQVAGSYTGQPVARNSESSKTTLVILLIVILALIAGAGVWWTLSDDVAEPIAVAESKSNSPLAVPEPEAAPVVSPESSRMEAADEPPVAVTVAPEPELAVSVTDVEPEPLQPAEVATSNAAPEIAVTEPAAIVAQKAPEPPAAQEQASSASRTPVEPVKQQRETPEAVDLRTSRELSRLLAAGQSAEAERMLTALAERQAAPRSREVFAREMLVQGMAARALSWLPDALTSEHVNLRLLKARALLEQGELNSAIATLSANVPPVADQVEYRITLATLLQQAGDADEAAGQWSELIAFDDSKAAWWLGLAIALETGGRYRSAVQAYAQSIMMPGLSASLADYARERLNALQAGS